MRDRSGEVWEVGPALFLVTGPPARLPDHFHPATLHHPVLVLADGNGFWANDPLDQWPEEPHDEWDGRRNHERLA